MHHSIELNLFVVVLLFRHYVVLSLRIPNYVGVVQRRQKTERHVIANVMTLSMKVKGRVGVRSLCI